MKYAVIICSNGNFKVDSEKGEDLEAARTAFYTKCAALSNAPDVISAEVMVADENLQPVIIPGSPGQPVTELRAYISPIQQSSQPTETTTPPIQQSSQPTETT